MKTQQVKENSRVPVTQEDTGIGIWYLDMAYDRLYLSDETFRIFGISKDNFQPYFRTFCKGIIHPGDRATWMYHWDLFIKDSASLDIEHRVIMPTGEVRHVHQRVERIVDIGIHGTWLKGSVRDITWETTYYHLKNPVA